MVLGWSYHLKLLDELGHDEKVVGKLRPLAHVLNSAQLRPNGNNQGIVIVLNGWIVAQDDFRDARVFAANDDRVLVFDRCVLRGFSRCRFYVLFAPSNTICITA